MVVCRNYETADKAIWDNFIEVSKTPLFLFKRDFIEYHADRFTDASLLFFEDQTLVAVLPASRETSILYSHAGLTYGGLILSAKVRIETVQLCWQSLKLFCLQADFQKIIYKAVPYIFNHYGADENLYLMTNALNAKLVRRDLSSVIYLNKRLPLSKGRKWLIARAKKMELEVQDSQNWQQFYDLLSEVLAFHNAKPVHSVAELQYLQALFPNNIHLKTIEQNGELLAACLLFKFNTTVVHTQYLATSEMGKSLGALDYLIEHCIAKSVIEGFDYFSFGVSTEQQGKFINMGLIAQKESFGARGLTLDFYEIDVYDSLS